MNLNSQFRDQTKLDDELSPKGDRIFFATALVVIVVLIPVELYGAWLLIKQTAPGISKMAECWSDAAGGTSFSRFSPETQQAIRKSSESNEFSIQEVLATGDAIGHLLFCEDFEQSSITPNRY